MNNDNAKTLTGYTDPLSLRAGDTVRLMASCLEPATVELDLVRIVCGDPTRSGPGFDERVVESALPPSVALHTQALMPGSYGEIDLRGVALAQELALELCLQPTRPETDQTALALEDTRGGGVALRIAGSRLVLDIDGHATAFGPARLRAGRWYRVDIRLTCGAPGQLNACVSGRPTRSPGGDYAAGLDAGDAGVTDTTAEVGL